MCRGASWVVPTFKMYLVPVVWDECPLGASSCQGPPTHPGLAEWSHLLQRVTAVGGSLPEP